MHELIPGTPSPRSPFALPDSPVDLHAGELKAFEYADTYGDRDVVVYGGDADLVAMALGRCARRGRLRILDENGRLIDVKSLAKRVAPAHPLDLAVLACVEINQCPVHPIILH